MRTVNTAVLLIMCVFLVACGPSQAEREAQETAIAANNFATQTAEATPSTISDDEFAISAMDVCGRLRAEIVSSQNCASWSDSYKQAAGALSDLEITEQSAPRGYLLTSYLGQLGEFYARLDEALTRTLSESDLETPVGLMYTEEDHVFAFSGDVRSVFERMASMEQLDIDPEVVREFAQTEETLRDVAASLGLEECTEAVQAPHETWIDDN